MGGRLTAPHHRVGVLGGTFDPLHLGHLIIAEEARAALGLDVVLFVPARRSPLKDTAPIATDDQRAAMIERAIGGAPAFRLSRVDLDRPGPSYTVETLALVQAEAGPAAALWFILGADALADLPAWRDPAAILDAARLAVFDRPGHIADLAALAAQIPGIRGRIDAIPAPLIGISATDLRRRAAAGRPIRYQVPASVEAYISAHRLYRR